MIHIFGDSFSDCTWPHMVSEKLNIEHVNYSKKGETNRFILTKIIENLKNFQKGDHIIIQTSGQGRLNVKNGVVYGDEVLYGVENLEKRGFSTEEWDIITKWYLNFHITEIFEEDPLINSIIHLANHLSNDFNVILWNLTALGFSGTKKINDNVSTSPKIPYSDLWLEESEGGKRGWLEIIVENGFEFSHGDPHPSIEGNKYIANSIIKRISPYI
jgi:hypothetical protein